MILSLGFEDISSTLLLNISIYKSLSMVDGGRHSARKIYVDSNVFLNVWFEEMIKKGEVFFSSKKLLRLTIDCHFFLIISNLTLMELAKKIGISEDVVVDEYLREFVLSDKIEIVKVSRRVAQDASYLYSTTGIHITDAIHAIVALLNQCILVTRDRELSNVAKSIDLLCCRPEDLIREFS